jgi:hypothetical protein
MNQPEKDLVEYLASTALLDDAETDAAYRFFRREPLSPAHERAFQVVRDFFSMDSVPIEKVPVTLEDTRPFSLTDQSVHSGS